MTKKKSPKFVGSVHEEEDHDKNNNEGPVNSLNIVKKLSPHKRTFSSPYSCEDGEAVPAECPITRKLSSPDVETEGWAKFFASGVYTIKKSRREKETNNPRNLETTLFDTISQELRSCAPLLVSDETLHFISSDNSIDALHGVPIIQRDNCRDAFDSWLNEHHGSYTPILCCGGPKGSGRSTQLAFNMRWFAERTNGIVIELSFEEQSWFHEKEDIASYSPKYWCPFSECIAIKIIQRLLFCNHHDQYMERWNEIQEKVLPIIASLHEDSLKTVLCLLPQLLGTSSDTKVCLCIEGFLSGVPHPYGFEVLRQFGKRFLHRDPMFLPFQVYLIMSFDSMTEVSQFSSGKPQLSHPCVTQILNPILASSYCPYKIPFCHSELKGISIDEVLLEELACAIVTESQINCMNSGVLSGVDLGYWSVYQIHIPCCFAFMSLHTLLNIPHFVASQPCGEALLMLRDAFKDYTLLDELSMTSHRHGITKIVMAAVLLYVRSNTPFFQPSLLCERGCCGWNLVALLKGGEEIQYWSDVYDYPLSYVQPNGSDITVERLTQLIARLGSNIPGAFYIPLTQPDCIVGIFQDILFSHYYLLIINFLNPSSSADASKREYQYNDFGSIEDTIHLPIQICVSPPLINSGCVKLLVLHFLENSPIEDENSRDNVGVATLQSIKQWSPTVAFALEEVISSRKLL